MSGAIFSEADFSGVNFKEGCIFYIYIFMIINSIIYFFSSVDIYDIAQISKAYARNSKFVNCDFTDGIVDR
jgi:uncharacterized protein YjbI with pentapeptide repeats